MLSVGVLVPLVDLGPAQAWTQALGAARQLVSCGPHVDRQLAQERKNESQPTRAARLLRYGRQMGNRMRRASSRPLNTCGIRRPRWPCLALPGVPFASASPLRADPRPSQITTCAQCCISRGSALRAGLWARLPFTRSDAAALQADSERWQGWVRRPQPTAAVPAGAAAS